MPFPRRFSRFSRRTGGFRRSRFASSVRSPTRAGQGRWQWGNVYFNQTFTSAAPGTINIMAELASLSPGHFADLSVGAGTQQVTMANMAKSIDIGGLVFDCGIHHSTINIDAASGSLSERFVMHQMIVLDRLSATGSPQGINAKWHVSTFPTNNIDASVPRPATTEEIRDYPSRILWRRSSFINPSLIEFNNFDSEALSALRQNEVYSPQRNRNLRIRKRLADDYGLYYLAAITPVPSISENLVFTCWLAGSLYYRVRY